MKYDEMLLCDVVRTVQKNNTALKKSRGETSQSAVSEAKGSCIKDEKLAMGGGGLCNSGSQLLHQLR